MRRIEDPFPPTPERFHLRVEQTLGALEEREMKHGIPYKKTVILVAAIVTALLMATAVAAVVRNAHFKEKLSAEGAADVAGLVQEVHLSDTAATQDGFDFTIDEIIWEDSDLYVSYSMTVPEDGKYLVALYTPTMNGERLDYDAKGFTLPKFIDQGGGQATALLLGGDRGRSCNELLTLKADPNARKRTDNHLAFRAVLLRTDYDFVGSADWTDMLNPPECAQFDKRWHKWAAPESTFPAESLYPVEPEYPDGYAEMMDTIAAAFGDDGLLTVDELASTGYAEVVAEREIAMDVDGTQMEEILFNDVAEHDFDRMGVHVHIDRFRMTHLGVAIEYTISVPGAKGEDEEAIRKLNDFEDVSWHFGTIDGQPLGYSLGGEGGGGWAPLDDGTPAYSMSWRESVILPTDSMGRIVFAPCEYVDDENGGNHPIYDMENAIVLDPVYSGEVAAIDAAATPAPTVDPSVDEADIDFSN